MATTTESTLSDLAGTLGKLDVKSKDLVTKYEKVVGDAEKVASGEKVAKNEKVTKDEINYCHTELAFCYGDKPAEWIRMVDEPLKIAAAAAVKRIQAIDEKERTWDKIVAQLQNLPMLQSTPDQDIHQEESFSTEHEGLVQGQSHDDITAQKVVAWFKHLIKDEDVMKATPINIEELAAILARVGTKLSVTKFISASTQREVTKKNIVDIGVLRFPELNDPYIKLYRIELMLVVENKLKGAKATDRGVICGGYHCRKYKPNADFIGLVSAEAKKKALAYAEGMCSDF